jgi:DNA-binding SARP family transcriptional activator
VHTVVTRVRQKVRDGEFEDAARLLAWERARASRTGSVDPLETVRSLCVAGAEHVRLARELSAAAGEHQGAVDEIRQRIDLLLAAQGAAPNQDVVKGSLRGDVVPEPDQAAPDVTVAVLGPLEVTVHGSRVSAWGGQKNRTLIQYLVLHADRPVHREVLMELLWPGHSYASARNNLNVALYGVRQALQGGVRADRYVVYRDGCYLLDPVLTWEIDRRRFLSLIAAARAEAQAGRTRAAIDLYESSARLCRGPLFEDDPNCEWFATEQRNLQELHLEVLEGLADLHLADHDYGPASETAQRILDEDACRESAHRVLMRCYSQQHQQSLIARQFQLCIAALRKEFSLSPTDETVRLFRALTATRGPALALAIAIAGYAQAVIVDLPVCGCGGP